MNTESAYTQNYTEGKKYQDYKNLSTTEVAKLVRKEIREKYPAKKGWRISVTRDYFSMGSSIDISVKDAPIQLYNKEFASMAQAGKWEEIRNRQYPSVHPDDSLKEMTPEGELLLDTLKRIAEQYNYNDCDGMIDYFNVNFWVNVGVHWEERDRLRDKSIEQF